MPKSLFARLSRSRIALFLFSFFVATVGNAQTEPQAGSANSWYATLSGGQVVNTEFDKSSVTIATNPFRIETVGNFDITNGWNYAATLGHEFGSDADIRLEGEFWGSQVQREGFIADQLDVVIDDKIRSRALFVNGLFRALKARSFNVWIGAGIGAADVRMLQAANSTCTCLREANGEGEAYRIKMSFESRTESGSAWFFEVGNVWLPATETDTSLSAYTLHGKLTSAEVRIGFKLAF